jgi:hypothetical protein
MAAAAISPQDKATWLKLEAGWLALIHTRNQQQAGEIRANALGNGWGRGSRWPTGAALSVAMMQCTRARIEERRQLHRGLESCRSTQGPISPSGTSRQGLMLPAIFSGLYLRPMRHDIAACRGRAKFAGSCSAARTAGRTSQRMLRSPRTFGCSITRRPPCPSTDQIRSGGQPEDRVVGQFNCGGPNGPGAGKHVFPRHGHAAVEKQGESK